MKNLPIGIQTFSKIINDNGVYIDKTRQIAELLQAGNYLLMLRTLVTHTPKSPLKRGLAAAIWVGFKSPLERMGCVS